MRKLIITSLIVLFTFAYVSADDTKSVIGTWNGALHVQGIKLRIAFTIIDSAGVLTALMDSPDQAAFGIPTDSAVVRNDSLFIYAAAMMAQYAGSINEDAMSITGSWSQGGMAMELNLEKGEKVEMNRPQEPKPPYPYLGEEISYENKEGKATLAGTFTRPKEGEKFAAVLLITGSGAQDRDEMIFNHRPFKVLADYLTRQGIAVLRVDDRGYAQSTGDIINATTEDFVGDAKAGVEYLKSRNDVDIKNIGLIGHSEGGIIAPMVASQSDDIAFIVLMAGTGLPGEEVLYTQSRAIMNAGEKDSSMAESNVELQGMMFDVLKKDLTPEETEKELRKAIDNWRASLDEKDKALIDSLGESFWDGQVQIMMYPWMKYFITLDPREYLKKVSCPVLAITGSMDLQVDADLNLPEIKKALNEGGNNNVRTEKLEGLNHIFQHCETGLLEEYGQIEETFAPEALKLIGDWIQEVTNR